MDKDRREFDDKLQEQQYQFERQKKELTKTVEQDKVKLEEGLKKLEEEKDRFQKLLKSQIDVTDLDVGGTHKFSVSTKVLTSI